jgi:tetratricopeptide (TPR) repeat protein
MRLLKLNDDGSFSLIRFSEDNIPPYAILSHTWGRGEDDEVTFKDITDGTGTDKRGFEKLRFCGRQAKIDDLHYFWVDTCCIDKSSSSELHTAITSMFRWYQNAERCYVYLSDVSVRTEDGQAHVEWESSFCSSRWFSRGWTLQELLAPNIVEFYSRDGVRLGSKISLQQKIHDVTGIAADALENRALTEFSINERLRWTKSRQTTVKEDAAYCLLGIFDVSMPLLYGEGQTKAMSRLLREIELPKQDPSPPLGEIVVTACSAVFNRQLDLKTPRVMPFDRNLSFTGRESELSKLQGLLFSPGQANKAAITGLGGVGKTQLAIELAYRIIKQHKDCAVFWIPATDLESLHQGYLAVAKELGIPVSEKDDVDVKHMVREYLSSTNAGKWLMVFDNADDINMWMNKPKSKKGSQRRLKDYLPQSDQGNVIFTTRDKGAAIALESQKVVEVAELSEETAKDLLQRHLIHPEQADTDCSTDQLLAQLTYLPLAIVQASAYINKNNTSITKYVSLLAEKDGSAIEVLSKDFEDYGRYANIKNPVATTWLISFERIEQCDKLAVEYLSFMACIEHKDIPESLLPAGPTQQRQIEAIGTLKAYSFVTQRPGSSVLDLHRLVHLAMHNWLLGNGRRDEWTSKTISRLAKVFPSNEHENRTTWRAYLPHAIHSLLSSSNEPENRSVWNLWRGYLPQTVYSLLTGNTSQSEESQLILSSKVGMCLLKDGRLNEAESYLMGAVEAQKKKLGDKNLDTLAAINNLGKLWRETGKFKDAENMHRQALEGRKSLLGREHPDVLDSLRDLAIAVCGQGDYGRAEQINLESLEGRVRVLGNSHLDTLISLSDLGVILWYQGKYKDAEEVNRRALSGRERVLGADHPDTLTSVSILAGVLQYQGKYEAAEEMNRRALSGYEKVLGVDHPSTLTSVSNLASVLENQGKYEAAEEMNRRALSGRENVLGVDHPHTLTSVYCLAYFYYQKKEYGLACDLFHRACEGFETSLGHDHPTTIKCRRHYSDALKARRDG